jgi:hypothetical protein
VKRGEVVKKEPGVFSMGEAYAISPADLKKVKCYHCQKMGHYKRDCRSLDREMAVKRAGKGDTGRGAARTTWRGRGGTSYRGGSRGSARGTGGRGGRFSSNRSAPRYRPAGGPQSMNNMEEDQPEERDEEATGGAAAAAIDWSTAYGEEKAAGN